ncbi:hypothetical protein Bca101_083117 [Brassica carinata]
MKLSSLAPGRCRVFIRIMGGVISLAPSAPKSYKMKYRRLHASNVTTPISSVCSASSYPGFIDVEATVDLGDDMPGVASVTSKPSVSDTVNAADSTGDPSVCITHQDIALAWASTQRRMSV